MSEKVPPQAGGCWICHTDDGWICHTDDGEEEMIFDIEYDTFVHVSCLEEHGVESVLEYERSQ